MQRRRRGLHGPVAEATRGRTRPRGAARGVALLAPSRPLGLHGEGTTTVRAIVTCECCGHRQTVARPIRRPESFYLVCHDCERTLRVDVTAEDIRAAELTTRTPSRAA